MVGRSHSWLPCLVGLRPSTIHITTPVIKSFRPWKVTTTSALALSTRLLVVVHSTSVCWGHASQCQARALLTPSSASDAIGTPSRMLSGKSVTAESLQQWKAEIAYLFLYFLFVSRFYTAAGSLAGKGQRFIFNYGCPCEPLLPTSPITTLLQFSSPDLNGGKVMAEHCAIVRHWGMEMAAG